MKHRELFQIGEISKLFHVSISTLRYYDRAGLVRPEYTDPETGYRYYSTRQFECLNTIRYLRTLDMPLPQIAEFLQNRDVESMQQSLERQRGEVRRRQRELELIERKIDNRLSQLRDAMGSRLDEPSLERLPARRIASLKRSLSPRDTDQLEYSIRILEESEKSTAIFLGKVGVGLSREKLLSGRYEPYDLVFLLLDEEEEFQGETAVLPESLCAVIRFCGGHETAAAHYGRLMAFLRENDCEAAGFSREITMIDYGLTNDLSRFVTEIQIPVTVAKKAAGRNKTRGGKNGYF